MTGSRHERHEKCVKVGRPAVQDAKIRIILKCFLKE
jgi:hypothetical protein